MKHVTHICCLLIMMTLFSCTRKKDIEVNLPAYKREMALEGYLETGRPVKILLTESVSYFSSPELSPVWYAFVTVRYKDKLDTLLNIPDFDEIHRKGTNYVSSIIVPEDYDSDFIITIYDSTANRQASARTRLMKKTPIESLRQVPAGGSLTNIELEFRDLPGKDFYRVLFFKDSLLSAPEVDLFFSDELYTVDQIKVRPLKNYTYGDTVIVELHHLSQEHFDYLQSTRNAIVANFDPLTSPAPIKSNVKGAIGIFTSVAADRDTVIIGH
jgi:hypothetical protein